MINRKRFNLLEYLADPAFNPENGSGALVPSLAEISEETGVGISTLREQLEAAKALGIVSVRPRRGITRLPYSFAPAVHQSLSFAISLDRKNFDLYSNFRNHIEASYFYQAVELLTAEDKAYLKNLVEEAWKKLKGNPVRLPDEEHQKLHMTIYKHIKNPFVTGTLDAYWEAYNEVGLNRYEGLEYLESVWTYHEQLVNAIAANDFTKGYEILIDHMKMIYKRPDHIY